MCLGTHVWFNMSKNSLETENKPYLERLARESAVGWKNPLASKNDGREVNVSKIT